MAIAVNHKKRTRNKANQTPALTQKVIQEIINTRNNLGERVQHGSGHITSKAYGEAAVIITRAQQEAKQIIQEAKRRAKVEEARYLIALRHEAEQQANRIIGEAMEQREKENNEFKNNLLKEFDKFSKVINEARQKLEQTVKISKDATGTDSEYISEVATQINFDEGKAGVAEPTVQVEVSPTDAEANSTKLYRGEVKLEVKSSGGYGQVGRFTERLRKIPNVKLTSLGSCVQEITIATIAIAEPIPLISILEEMPMVEEVIEQDKYMKVIL